MAFVAVGVSVRGDRQVSRAFDNMGLDTRDQREPIGRFMDGLVDAVETQMDTQGAAGLGQKWQSLSPAYARWKLKRYGPRPILVATGQMRRSLLNRRAAVRVTRTRGVYEPLTGKAGRHQRGGGNLPQRKIVSLTTAEKHRLVDQAWAEWLHKLKQEHLGNG